MSGRGAPPAHEVRKADRTPSQPPTSPQAPHVHRRWRVSLSRKEKMGVGGKASQASGLWRGLEGVGGNRFLAACLLPKAAISHLENYFPANFLPSSAPSPSPPGIDFCSNTSPRKQSWKEHLIFQDPGGPLKGIWIYLLLGSPFLPARQMTGV